MGDTLVPWKRCIFVTEWLCLICMITKDEFVLTLYIYIFITWDTFSGFDCIKIKVMKKILFQKFCVWMYHCFSMSVSYCSVTNQPNFSKLKTKSIYHLPLLMDLKIQPNGSSGLHWAQVQIHGQRSVGNQQFCLAEFSPMLQHQLDADRFKMTPAKWNLFHMISQSIWLGWVCSHGRGRVPRESGSTSDQWNPAWTWHILIFTAFSWPTRGRGNPFHLLMGGTDGVSKGGLKHWQYFYN